MEAFEYYKKFYLRSQQLEKEARTPSSLLNRVYSSICFSGINFILKNEDAGVSVFTEAMQSLTMLFSEMWTENNYDGFFDKLNSDSITVKQKINLLNSLVDGTNINQLSDTEKQHVNNLLTYMNTFLKICD